MKSGSGAGRVEAGPSRGRLAAVAAVLAAAMVMTVGAQEHVDEAVIARMKIEGFQRSQVMETLSWLTDVHGPRLSGSANYRKAAEWARDKMTTWGLANARLEAWGDFGPAWAVNRFSVEMIEPTYTRIVAYPLAWTSSTPGVVRGTPTLVEIRSEADFEKYRGKLSGAIVMLGRPSPAASPFEPPATRLTVEDLTKVEGAIDPGSPASLASEDEGFQRMLAGLKATVDFLAAEKVAALIEPSIRDNNVLEVAGVAYYTGTEPRFPGFVISKEQYGRILRLLDKKVPVTLELSLTTTFDASDTKGYNVLAEIPGSDSVLRDEVVMLGGHFDSWHAGTGAVDNGAGSAVAMEAVRIMQALGLKPRRTVRIALWGGEEQDYFGSVGYVAAHFGNPRGDRVPTAEQAKISGYFNVDNGSGRIRGVNLQGNELVRPIFEAWLEPFQYLEASTLTVQNTGGTDHMPFDALGIPAFQFIQDPLDYDSRRHHTSIDVYEAASEPDMQQAAVILASFVYHAAMRDDMLPRRQ